MLKLNYKLLIVATFLLTSCGVFKPSSDGFSPPDTQPTPVAESMVTFRLTLPQSLPSGESVELAMLDEITGLPFNQKRFPMQIEDGRHLILVLPLPLNSVIKYRYVRQGIYSAQEYTANARPVRYRMIMVHGPEMVQDVISRWIDTSYEGPSGRITGKALDLSTGNPISGILILAGGMQTTTANDGSFRLEGLPPGTHNLVAYSPNGSYGVFQQGATVVGDSETPTIIGLSPLPLVKLVFVASVPDETPEYSVIRLAGNLRQLGNTFANQRGEVSSMAILMPELSRLPDGRYTATLEVPVGVEFIYRYTLGDGLWNAEHMNTGAYRDRRIITPDHNMLIEDKVETWHFGNPAPITFFVTIPQNTPPGEITSIQFNPGYGWTEPIPMWHFQGSYTWVYTLFGPLVGLDVLNYRYCRDVQCGSADEIVTPGNLAKGRQVSVLSTPQTMTDQVDAWIWWDGPGRTAVVPSNEIARRIPDFIAGISFQAEGYHPSWEKLWASAINEIAGLNSNWIVLSPTWAPVHLAPPVFEPVMGIDMGENAVSLIHIEAQRAGMQVALFPTLRFSTTDNDWWKNAPRDFSWWVSWFESYRVFITDFANQAAQNNAAALIIGGDWLLPALPGGKVGGVASGVPFDAEQRWRQMLGDLRALYNGKIFWALSYSETLQPAPAFLDQVDGLYIIWSAKISDTPELDLASMVVQAGNQLDTNVLPLAEKVGKPVVLAISYPSAQGGVRGCVVVQEGTCVDLDALSRPNPDLQGIILNLDEQEAAYNAMFQAVNTRPWISGFISQGFYSPVPIQDKSISVRGKPTAGVIWYWFGRFLGK